MSKQGESVNLKAKARLNNWDPIDSYTIYFQYASQSDPDNWHTITSSQTNRYGEVKIAWNQNLDPGTYYIRAKAYAQGEFSEVKSGETVLHIYKSNTRIDDFSINFGEKHCFIGDLVEFCGFLRTREGSGIEGQIINFIYSNNGGEDWNFFTSDTSTANNGYAYQFTTMNLAPGDYLFLAQYDEGNTYGSCVSTPIELHVIDRYISWELQSTAVAFYLTPGESNERSFEVTNLELENQPCTVTERSDTYGIITLGSSFTLNAESTEKVAVTANVPGGLSAGTYIIYADITILGITRSVAITVYVNELDGYYVNPGGFNTGPYVISSSGAWTYISFTLSSAQVAQCNDILAYSDVIITVIDSEASGTFSVNLNGVLMNDHIADPTFGPGDIGFAEFHEWTSQPTFFASGANYVGVRLSAASGSITVDTIQLRIKSGKTEVIYDLGFAQDQFIEERHHEYTINTSQKVCLYNYWDFISGTVLSDFQFDYYLPSGFVFDQSAISHPQWLSATFGHAQGDFQFKSIIHIDTPGIYVFNQGDAWAFTGDNGLGMEMHYYSNSPTLIVKGSISPTLTPIDDTPIGESTLIKITCRDQNTSALLNGLTLEATITKPDLTTSLITLTNIGEGVYQGYILIDQIGDYSVSVIGYSEIYNQFGPIVDNFIARKTPFIEVAKYLNELPVGKEITTQFSIYDYDNSNVTMSTENIHVQIIRPDLSLYSLILHSGGIGKWYFTHSDLILGNYTCIIFTNQTSEYFASEMKLYWNRTNPILIFEYPFQYQSINDNNTDVLFSIDSQGGSYNFYLNGEEVDSFESGSMIVNLTNGFHVLTIEAWDEYSNYINGSIVIDVYNNDEIPFENPESIPFGPTYILIIWMPIIGLIWIINKKKKLI